jgi:hypothetical protein
MDIFEVKNVFIISILSIIGLITNILSIIVFILIIKSGQRDDMYKYLLLKSICEALGCIFSAFYPMYYYFGSLTYTKVMAIWYIWFQNYIIKALFMASTRFEIAATFSCAISIEKRMKWCQKRLSFWLWVISVFVLSFGVEMFPVFTAFVKESPIAVNKFNRTIYQYNVFYNHLVFKNWEFNLSESIVKEIMFLIILLLLNIYILFKLIQIGRRKKKLTSNIANIQNNNRARKRKIVMMIILFLTFLLGHLPNVVYFGVNTHFYANVFWTDFKAYGEIFLYLSYSTSFFVYFVFNNNFKCFFLKIIHALFNY